MDGKIRLSYSKTWIDRTIFCRREPRLCLLVLFLAIWLTNSSKAIADRIILAPSAYALTNGFEGGALQTVQRKPQTLSYVGVGTSTVQLDVDYVSRPTVDRLAVSAQSLILPETFVTPAVSVGIRDIANSAGTYRADNYYGRGYYVVATKGLDNNTNPPKIHGVSLTAGIGVGSIRGLFGGVSSDLPLKLIGTVEFDSRQMNYRVALPIFKIGSVSYDRLGAANFVGLQVRSPISM